MNGFSKIIAGAAFAVATFFCFAWQKDQISSHWMREAFTSRTVSSWMVRQASPASTSSLETVLIDTSATRLIERMDDPSQSMARIWARVAIGSLFIYFLYELLCLASIIMFFLTIRSV